MDKLQKKILKRAKSFGRKPVEKHETKNRKFLASALGLALLLAWRRRRARRPGKRLRNAQGVGPSHIRGVAKGEELVDKKGTENPGHPAGRLVGSIRPS